MRARKRDTKRAGNWRGSATPIGKLLAKAGKTQSDIARDLGITSQAVNSALSGRSRNMRVWTAVSEATGVPMGELITLVQESILASARALVAESAAKTK